MTSPEGFKSEKKPWLRVSNWLRKLHFAVAKQRRYRLLSSSQLFEGQWELRKKGSCCNGRAVSGNVAAAEPWHLGGSVCCKPSPLVATCTSGKGKRSPIPSLNSMGWD